MRVPWIKEKIVFNGAALFQVRKALADLEKQTISIQSSMGPHFFKCGKVINNPYNNAAFLLQWGRTFSSAESIDIYTQSVIKWFSSMGPHFFKCGKKIDWLFCRHTHAVFNGAALFQVRKDCQSVQPTTDPSFFNGAALFQVRKATVISIGSSPVELFNGAALFQVRKVAIRNSMAATGQVLQWGRTFSSAESQRPSISFARMAFLQWGRTFSSAESVQLGLIVNHDPELFNGAALFQVRKENKLPTPA